MGIFGTVTFVHETMWACLGGDRKREKTRMPKRSRLEKGRMEQG